MNVNAKLKLLESCTIEGDSPVNVNNYILAVS